MYRFNVRVYGILIHEENVLVSDEYIKGKFITKFPGGGLEFGEGTLDCVVREFKEELGLDVEVILFCSIGIHYHQPGDQYLLPGEGC
jgi:8-oxo-dGTP diphosphatase